MPTPHILPRSAQPPAPLDTRAWIETPESIDLLLRPAGFVARAMAFGIDFSLRAAILGGLLLLFSLFETFGAGLSAIVLFLITWWYTVLFEVLNQGRTPGKQLMGLRVIHDDGTPVGWSASMIRNLLRFVDMLPFGYGLGAISCLHHPAFKRLGDLAAGTLVVYRDTLVPRPHLPEGPAIITPFVMRLDEQRAILSLAERQGELSSARVHELAVILAEPLQVSPEQAVAHLNGVARGLQGAP